MTIEMGTPSWLQMKIDEAAVGAFASAMQNKLNDKNIYDGKRGWHVMPIEELLDQFCDHIVKGDLVDIGNYCAMLNARDVPKNVVAAYVARRITGEKK